MNTNFFRALLSMQAAGDWTIGIKQQEDQRLTVSVIIHADKVGDKAAQKIPPMIFKGTAEELDSGFFNALKQPVEQTSALFANMEHYMKQVEEARLQSQMEKDKASKQKKEQEERKKKYDSLIKKVDELEAAKKYQEAIAALPKAEQFPEQADEIKKRLEELRKKNGQLSLM